VPRFIHLLLIFMLQLYVHREHVFNFHLLPHTFLTQREPWYSIDWTLPQYFKMQSQIHMLYVSSTINRYSKDHNIHNTQSYIGERRYNSTLFWTWHYLEVCGQLPALASLNPEQDSPIATEQEPGWFPHSLWMLWGREKFLDPARHQTLIT
jgi:hypothetical protein